ncbi:hypothetical protein MMC13_001786 [Lambiella insularis]|nr:hypothetical protein [Lambiella insularis]
MATLHYLSALLIDAKLATGYTAFWPNCTAPADDVTFVASNPSRGTMDVHLAVPLHVKPEKKKKKPHFWNRFSGGVRDKKRTVSFWDSPFMDKRRTIHKRDFGHEGWTITNGHFANMRGFVLRFDVAAVRTPLVPSKPSERGRELQQPNPDREPPYVIQNAERAKEIELEHCHQFCHVPCEHRDYSADIEQDPSTSSPMMISPVEPLKQIEDSLSESFSAQTLTNNQDFPTPRTAKATSHTLIDGQESSSPHTAKVSSPSAASQARPSSIAASQPHSATPSDPSTTISESDILHPHIPWRASWALSAPHLLYAFRSGVIPSPPSISYDELSDRSKGDTLIKALAILQITWLVIQIIARAFQNLTITLLEVTVLATAGCAITTDILLWHKPQDIMVPIYIDAPKLLTREQVIQLAARSPVSTLNVHEFGFTALPSVAWPTKFSPLREAYVCLLPAKSRYISTQSCMELPVPHTFGAAAVAHCVLLAGTIPTASAFGILLGIAHHQKVQKGGSGGSEGAWAVVEAFCASVRARKAVSADRGVPHSGVCPAEYVARGAVAEYASACELRANGLILYLDLGRRVVEDCAAPALVWNILGRILFQVLKDDGADALSDRGLTSSRRFNFSLSLYDLLEDIRALFNHIMLCSQLLAHISSSQANFAAVIQPVFTASRPRLEQMIYHA